MVPSLQTLEGRWVSPDPLAVLLRATLAGDDNPPNAETLAAVKRRRTPGLVAADVRKGIVEALQRESMYRVRWTE